MVGGRDADTANLFIQDLKDRLANRVQLTTDGHRLYLDAVEKAFGMDVDNAMLIKLYGTPAEGRPGSAERRYSPRKSSALALKPSRARRTRTTPQRV